MKKLVNNAIVAAMVFAATMMNTVNAFANNSIDTLRDGDGYEASISPDEEDAIEENAAVVENWMLENIFEAEATEANAVEAWMTENMYEANEIEAGVENWMTENIYMEAEEINEVEAWMTETIYTAEEEEIQLEAWMF